MKTKLLKNLIRMTKFVLYSFIVQSLFCSLALSHNSEAQIKKLNEIFLEVSFSQSSLEAAFKMIEQKTEFDFAYIAEDLPQIKVTLNFKKRNLEDILLSIAEQSGISFKRVKTTIHVKTATNNQPKLEEILEVNAQTRNITGKVTSYEDGEGLPGVNVVEKGTSNGTVTDVQGNYSLEVSEGATLVFSSVGYTQEEVEVGNRSVLDLTMTQDIQQLQELVVVGYGEQEKSDITGAVSSVKSEDLQKIPTANVVESLQGRAAGMQITQSNGQPGGNGLNILIRGQNSLTANNSPLIVVDGVPLADLGGQNLNDFNVNDIESIEILKDASASAIYGARGANGVVLITTRRGKDGKTIISYNGSSGISDIANEVRLFNGPEYEAYRKEAFNAIGETDDNVIYTDEMLTALNNQEYVDWTDLIIDQGSIQNHNISITGGNEKLKTAFSAGYFKENGIVAPSSFERGTIRLNLDYKVSEKLNLTANFNYSRLYENLNTSNFSQAILAPPLSVVYNENGSLKLEPYGDPGQLNPLLAREDNIEERWRNRTFGNLVATYEFTDNISYNINVALDSRNSKFGEFTLDRVGDQNNAALNYGDGLTYTVENILNFNTILNDNHNIDATLLYSIQADRQDDLSSSSQNLSSNNLGYDAIELGTDITGVGRMLEEWQLESYMARIRYELKDKYLLTVTGRVDGSSKFGSGNKYGFFPSAAIGWKIDQEQFLNNINNLDQLKIRASYGKIGNQEIPIFQSLPVTENIGYTFGSDIVIGSVPASLANPDLKWETTLQFNLGLDFSFFAGRINGALEFYNSQTRDLLLAKKLPPTSGFDRVVTNIGETKNNGLELLLNATILDIGDFQWSTSINLARNRSEIVSLAGEVDESGNPVDDIANRWFIGEPIGVVYDFQKDGVWQLDDDIENSAQPEANPGEPKVVDQNNDGVITSVDDRIILGNSQPSWHGGITNTFKYKGLELNIFINTVQGVFRFNDFLDYPYSLNSGRWNGVYRNYWTPQNPSNEWYRPNVNNGRPAFWESFRYQNASFVALRNVTLAYNFPKSLINDISINNLRIYLTGTNLNYWTDFISYSPESNGPGTYPHSKSYVLGLNITL